mmetsp:Transcript_24726/g.68841  ORF Transcript_24726/g.68841 Transcript_24726/m.68841 type:complete len:263 (-) Transcript_24726:516-1304(-)
MRIQTIICLNGSSRRVTIMDHCAMGTRDAMQQKSVLLVLGVSRPLQRRSLRCIAFHSISFRSASDPQCSSSAWCCAEPSTFVVTRVLSCSRTYRPTHSSARRTKDGSNELLGGRQSRQLHDLVAVSVTAKVRICRRLEDALQRHVHVHVEVFGRVFECKVWSGAVLQIQQCYDEEGGSDQRTRYAQRNTGRHVAERCHFARSVVVGTFIDFVLLIVRLPPPQFCVDEVVFPITITTTSIVIVLPCKQTCRNGTLSTSLDACI